MSTYNLSGNSSQEKVGKLFSDDGGVPSAVEGNPDDDVDVAEKGIGTSLDNGPEIPDKQGALQRTVTAQDWTGPDDPENPLNWPLWQRIYHTTVPGLFGFAVTLGSSVCFFFSEFFSIFLSFFL